MISLKYKMAKKVFNNNITQIAFSISVYLLGLIIGFILSSLFSPDLSVFGDNPINPKELNFITFLQVNGLLIFSLISGSFLLGTITIAGLFLNGFLFGSFVSSLLQDGESLILFIKLIFLHGIFELPAMWIAGAAGFKIPYELIRYFTGKKDYILSKEEVKEFLILSATAIVLIIIAAIIEANVTSKIAEML